MQPKSERFPRAIRGTHRSFYVKCRYCGLQYSKNPTVNVCPVCQSKRST